MEKKDEKENQLKRTKSRELRGGIMYYSCHCIKRNGLQHDCRRTGCGGEPACLGLPDPLCAPSQLARARGLADPAPLADHVRAQAGRGISGGSAMNYGSGGAKRFIVCELKGIVPDATSDKSGECCKCLTAITVPIKSSINKNTFKLNSSCRCDAADAQTSLFVFDQISLKLIFKCFESKELAIADVVVEPGGRARSTSRRIHKQEICTRPGCVHWKPPPLCVWDKPCKADCFETPLGKLEPPQDESSGGSKETSGFSGYQKHDKIKLLTPNCCTGCSASSGGGTSSSGGPAAGIPVMVMKLC